MSGDGGGPVTVAAVFDTNVGTLVRLESAAVGKPRNAWPDNDAYDRGVVCYLDGVFEPDESGRQITRVLVTYAVLRHGGAQSRFIAEGTPDTLPLARP